MRLHKAAVLSIDTDWAPQELVQTVVENILPKELPVTFFTTDRYHVLEEHQPGYEIEPHTNPPTLSEKDLEEELVSKMSFCQSGPIIGHRGHSLYWTERLRPVFRRNGIKYDSSTMMYLKNKIEPFKIGHDLLEIPLFFMDMFHLECAQLAGKEPFDIDILKLQSEGLKVFDFHPVHLFLNTPHPDYYAEIKSDYHNPENLSRLINQKYGMKNFFEDIYNELDKLGYSFMTLQDVYHSTLCQ